MVVCLQDVAGLEERELVFWERGKLNLKFLHIHSTQALSVSKRVHKVRGAWVRGA